MEYGRRLSLAGLPKTADTCLTDNCHFDLCTRWNNTIILYLHELMGEHAPIKFLNWYSTEFRSADSKRNAFSKQGYYSAKF